MSYISGQELYEYAFERPSFDPFHMSAPQFYVYAHTEKEAAEKMIENLKKQETQGRLVIPKGYKPKLIERGKW